VSISALPSVAALALRAVLNVPDLVVLLEKKDYPKADAERNAELTTWKMISSKSSGSKLSPTAPVAFYHRALDS